MIFKCDNSLKDVLSPMHHVGSYLRMAINMTNVCLAAFAKVSLSLLLLLQFSHAADIRAEIATISENLNIY
ncbi:hypothetical protein A3709_10710 [Halioglobus sp. HI00S01]|nr:hypothetical protein A3709_10710 [Halioglobus sp. HI00S01]